MSSILCQLGYENNLARDLLTIHALLPFGMHSMYMRVLLVTCDWAIFDY